MQPALDGRQASGEGGVRRRSHRRCDPYRQRARRQLVVGEQCECCVHCIDEFGRGTPPPRACQALGEAPGPARGAEHDRCRHEQPSGGIGRPVVGTACRKDVGGDCDSSDRRDGQVGNRRECGAQRRLGRRPSRGRCSIVARPEELGDVLETTGGRQLDRLDAPKGQSVLVDRRDARGDLDVDRRPRSARRAPAPFGELLHLVAGEERRSPVRGGGAGQATSAHVGVEGRLRDVEDRGRLGRSDQRAHDTSFEQLVDRVNVDSINVDSWG